MNDFINIQPDFCRSPLPVKDLDWDKIHYSKDRIDWFKTMLYYDPGDIYNNLKDILNANKRIQPFRAKIAFPQHKNICACGCGEKLPKGLSRWRNSSHQEKAYGILNVICGIQQTISPLITFYYDEKCARCQERIVKVGYEIDHIIPVKHGGGGCWLSNYQPLCPECHKKKTKEDFGWGIKKVEKNYGIQLELF